MDEHDYSCISKKDFSSISLSDIEIKPSTSHYTNNECDIKLTKEDEIGIKQPSMDKQKANSALIQKERLVENIEDAGVVNIKSETNSEASLCQNESRENVNEDLKKMTGQKKLFRINELSPLKSTKKERDMDDNEIGEYCFETDHLALRGNQDYLMVLKTIAILEAQRTKAIKDLERLIDAKEEALADPIAFVEKLQRGEDLNLPSPQRVYPLPVIDWDKYLVSFNPNALKNRRIVTRRQIAEPTKPNATDVSQILQSSQNSIRSSNHTNSAQAEGRSQTYNQPWTAEEQKRLEELLVKFPPEEIESRRWEKIARALGNRTRQQVASRVQKYFIKLTKAGLPVPGRTPNISNYVKRGHSHRHQRHNRYLFQPSTFFASYDPPVYMCDNDDDTISSCNISTTSSIDGDAINDKIDPFSIICDDDTSPELKETEEYRELIKLTKLRKDKIQSSTLPQHVGFKCDVCDCDPIIGTRWHCADCPPDSSVDFCEDCVDFSHETATHLSTHRLLPIAAVPSKPYVDGDYTSFMPGNYNYLDPNYMPAT